MPYNKGDFTQQGINGDVSALVRLNEKRVMKVVLSSDDESDNCDISGKVYDLLNGTSYDIGAGGGGGEIPTLTITLKPAPDASVAELGAIASFNGTTYVKVPYSSISTDTNTEIIDLYYYLGSETTYMQYSAFSDIVTGVITGTYGDFVNCALNDWGDLIIADPTLPSSCSITFTAIGPR